MMSVNIICVGKLKEKYWRDACLEYGKRLCAFCRFSVVEVEESRVPDRPSPAQILSALASEGKRILAKCAGSHLIALCIEGKEVSSLALSKVLQDTAVGGVSSVDFVIGGSWGLSDEVKQAASWKLSMSPMTFPHQMARVMLCEQIYRAFQIAHDGKYHK